MKRASQPEGDGPPDPAAWLDRLERSIERRLPAEPRPVWAAALVFLLRLLLGRGSWVLGALLAALGAPWFVFAYRQVETMALAAWYRRTAEVVTQARIESIELRLLPWTIDGGQRVIPSLLLRPERAGGEGPATVRYLPYGQGLEDFRQPYLSDRLLWDPPRVSPGFRLLWREAGETGPGFDLTWRAEDDAALRSAAGWTNGSYLDNAIANLDRPVDLLVGDWVHAAAEGRSVSVRHRADEPERLFVADALEHPPPAGGSGLGELFGAIVLILPFGLPFWWFGTRLLGRGLPPAHRHLLVWVPLALLPFWGSRYLEVLDRLSPGALTQNALLSKAGSHQVLPGSEPASGETGGAGIRRYRVDLASSRFAEVLARVDLSLPDPPPRSGAEVWSTLSQRFADALLPLDDAALAATIAAAAAAESQQGAPALLAVMLDTARRILLDEARGEAPREWGRSLISTVLQASALDVCHPGFAAHRADLERLRALPDAELAALATARLAELDQRAAWLGHDGRGPCS